ncbi:TetR family transcriptional regulator [Streptomyces sp. BR123]|uniref:TetR/AcrR family transcriptional regulator n=1 Tax=Streptomyces sp. BR123 TaxID=2749828 RepID=UPI0015C4E78E|nr:TetR/AcrR family transcriptional regulator [Streptomyces sp. BR123]NXY93256.1 TetR family transcriptional regulator [Streptomyces sp. BR123]
MEKAADTRQRIIDAVLRIIGDEGIAALSNRRIAKEAQVSLGSVTYHFATQHELLRESLLHFVAQETRHFTELAENCATIACLDVEGAAELVETVAGGTAFDSRHIAPFELYVQAGRDERLRAAASDCFAAYDRLAHGILERLGLPNPQRLAGAVVALVFGQQLRRLATGAPAEELVDTLLLLTGSAVGTGGGAAQADRAHRDPATGRPLEGHR